MERALARKRPATVTTRTVDRPVPIGIDYVTNRNPYLLESKIREMQAKGFYGPASRIRVLPSGRYAAKVEVLRAVPPRWRKRAVIAASVAAGLATVLGLIVYTVVSLLGAVFSLPVTGGVVMVFLILCGAPALAGGHWHEVAMRWKCFDRH